jgi:TrmH family RNA methyltransferase
MKLLKEAVAAGAEITSVLCRETLPAEPLPNVPVYTAPEELFRYVSPMEESPGPLFTVRMHSKEFAAAPERVIVLENLQDPANMGAVFRSAEAFGMDAVILAGNCCDVYAPKAVRAGMGAVFRLNLLRTASGAEAAQVLRKAGVATYAAVAHGDARKPHEVRLNRGCAVMIGNEGNGLTAEAIAACDYPLTIPMGGRAESLNAAAAAAILIWEMVRNEKA